MHNDLKANNVVIDGAENKSVIIDFGKSYKIVKARLRKPKDNIEKAMKKFLHIALVMCFPLAFLSFVYSKRQSWKFHQP